MTVLEILTIPYIVIGVGLALALIVTCWKSGDARIFLFGLVAAGFVPVFWGPLLIGGGTVFLLCVGIQKIMDRRRA